MRAVTSAAACFLLATSVVTGATKSELREQYQGKTFYLQHNLYFADNEADWVNFIGTGDYIDVGTELSVRKVGPEYLVLENTRLGHKVKIDLDDCLPDVRTVIDRILGEAPPSLAVMTDTDLEGIRTARVIIGMSRRAVFLAVGYPPHYYSPPFFFDKKGVRNHHLDADELMYMESTFDFLAVRFKDDKVVSVED